MNKLVKATIWSVVIVSSAFMLYRVKYEVQSIRLQIAQTTKELAAEKQSLHVVAAEWAYLNRPDRLQRLADKYLATKNTTVKQVAEVEAIAFPTQMQASVSMENELRIAPISYQKNAIVP